MKVVLINPPENSNLRLNFIATQYPLNLGYLAAVLLKNNFEVELWDYVVEPFVEAEFIERIKKSDPKLIGFSTMTNTVATVSKLAQKIRDHFKDIKIIAGGTHVSALPTRTMKEIPALDYICVGEGELMLLDICNYLDAGHPSLTEILGLVYRKENEIIQNSKRSLIADIDTIPFPARNLVDPKFYRRTHISRGIPRKFLNVSELFTSRGCPNQCIFCAGHISYGFNVRFRSVENVFAEVKECVEKLKTSHFTISDDTFTLIPKRTFELCDGFKKLGVKWDCTTRVNNISREMLFKMAESGCIKVSFGVEASSERLLKLIKKGITLDQIRQAVKWVKEAKIKIIEGTFILGSHPSETKEEVEMTIKLMRELDLDFISYGIIAPFPGTEVHDIMKQRGFISDDVDWNKFIFIGAPPWRIDNFTPEELANTQKRVLRKFYLRPRYILKRILKIRSWEEARYYLDVAKDFFTTFFV